MGSKTSVTAAKLRILKILLVIHKINKFISVWNGLNVTNSVFNCAAAYYDILFWPHGIYPHYEFSPIMHCNELSEKNKYKIVDVVRNMRLVS